MRRLIFLTTITAGLAVGCTKGSDEKIDYSQTIFAADPSWERVGIVPWQDGENKESERRYTLGDLRLSPSGELLLAYVQGNQHAAISDVDAPVYLASTTPGKDQIASVSPTAIALRWNGGNPQFFQDPPAGKVFACTALGVFKIYRSDGLGDASMGISLATDVTLHFGNRDLGPRYLPRYHSTSGDLVFNNDVEAILNTTEIYNTYTNSWFEIGNPTHPDSRNDWFSYQTGNGVTGYCELQVYNDSVYLSIYQLNRSTRQFDSVYARLLPEFSGRGNARDCAVLSYNDEESLVIAVARYNEGKPVEVSTYKMAAGSPQLNALYQSVVLPAAAPNGSYPDWGVRSEPFAGASACTPDGMLYDLVKDVNRFCLVTVDAAGVHEKARFESNDGGQLARWPVTFLNGSFYLLAQNRDYPVGNKDFRLEILRVK